MLGQLPNGGSGGASGAQAVGSEEADVGRAETHGKQGGAEERDKTAVAQILLRLGRRAVTVDGAQNKACCRCAATAMDLE